MRKYKGRECFDGRPHMVRDKYGKHVIFQKLHSVPPGMPAGKSGLAAGQLPGMYVKTADAEKAYCQSWFKGIPTWTELPRCTWPASWAGMKCPVCFLERNICA